MIYLEALLESTRPTKPVKCDRPSEADSFPQPRGVEIKAPIDSIEQGQAYGDGWSRGKITYDTRTLLNNTFWDACDKQYDTDVEKYDADIAARVRAVERIKELSVK